MQTILEEAVRRRRAGRFRDALRLVTPLVYPQGKLRPREGAAAEYALSLAQLGAPEAAEALLVRVGGAEPKDLFARAICRMLLWKHAEAARDLEEYRARVDPDGYDAWVAFANLLWCRLYEGRTDEIHAAYRDAAGRIGRHPVLHANARATLAKASFLHRLRTGVSLPPPPPREAPRLSPYDDLALRFSGMLEGAVPRARRATAGPRVAAGLIAFEAEGRAKGLFEFARECSLWRSLLCSGAPTPLERGFGTPFAGFAAYARLVASWLGDDRDPGHTGPGTGACYVDGGWTDATPAGATTVDPWKRGETPFTRMELRYLSSLVRDTHRPATLERLFLESHEGAPFQPDSSPQVVHVTLARLRRRFAEAGYDWDLRATRGHGFELRVSRPGIRVPRAAYEGAAYTHPDADTVLESLTPGGCSRAALEDATGLHPRKLARVLTSLIERGSVARVGRGPAVCYLKTDGALASGPARNIAKAAGEAGAARAVNARGPRAGAAGAS